MKEYPKSRKKFLVATLNYCFKCKKEYSASRMPYHLCYKCATEIGAWRASVRQKKISKKIAHRNVQNFYRAILPKLTEKEINDIKFREWFKGIIK